MLHFFQSSFAQEMINYHCPRAHELPDIELYMDQVISIVENSLKNLRYTEDEKIITASMVNNYVKQKVVNPPKNKRYTKTHVIYLLVVCILKQTLSISDICRLIRHQIDFFPTEDSYNYFCEELETVLRCTFSGTQPPALPQDASQETILLRAAILTVANKLYIGKFLRYRDLQKAEELKT